MGIILLNCKRGSRGWANEARQSRQGKAMIASVAEGANSFKVVTKLLTIKLFFIHGQWASLIFRSFVELRHI